MTGSGLSLAERLRQLRLQEWPGVKITQQQIADALDVSVPLVSSWESANGLKVPPVSRLEAYAALFSSVRSLQGGALRILGEDELTDEERRRRDELRRELLDLRTAALGKPTRMSSALRNPWVFGDEKPITIVCGRTPDELLRRLPYTNPEDPHHVEIYKYADLDALFHLLKYVCAWNPNSDVNIQTVANLESEHHNGHLVLLGGVDWNPGTRELLEDPDLPVRQINDWDRAPEGIYFEVRESENQLKYHPELEGDRLLADVGLFYRGPHPYRTDATVTICNGMYARGTLGVVMALTDPSVRDRNVAYLQRRFHDQEVFSLLTKIVVLGNKMLPPDWTKPVNRLYEWPPTA